MTRSEERVERVREALLELRERHGWSYRELERELQVAHATLWKRLTGKLVLDLKTVFDILEVFDEEPTTFFTQALPKPQRSHQDEEDSEELRLFQEELAIRGARQDGESREP